MCGRFELGSMDDHGLRLDVARFFDVEGGIDLRSRFNIAPTQSVAAVRRTSVTAPRELAMLRWGLIPSWAKDPAIGVKMINARAETAHEKPAFRAAFKQRRCLVIATSFYEWQRLEGGPKQPWRIHLADREPFGMAGLWESWRDAGGAIVESCTIITTSANELVAPLHDRMPVILARDACDVWLDPGARDVEKLRALLVPFPAAAMARYAVSTRVNNVRNDDVMCVQPLMP